MNLTKLSKCKLCHIYEETYMLNILYMCSICANISLIQTVLRFTQMLTCFASRSFLYECIASDDLGKGFIVICLHQ